MASFFWVDQASDGQDAQTSHQQLLCAARLDGRNFHPYYVALLEAALNFRANAKEARSGEVMRCDVTLVTSFASHSQCQCHSPRTRARVYNILVSQLLRTAGERW